ncbi:NEDD4-binding protein 2 [Nephila pilipes]|uniref:NEDD4-binding protein 2 n=1 Tax=Nephila pilipes TaxID=299642 RepID=A0A8X6TQT6_NEPPI|nr:NEDD4-binding protein 2 [Nephila pilipes]
MPKKRNNADDPNVNKKSYIKSNEHAVLDDTDPHQSLQFLTEIFASKIKPNVIQMVYSEGSLNMDQAVEILMSLSNEDSNQTSENIDGIKDKSESVGNSMNALQKSFVTANKINQNHEEYKLKIEVEENNTNTFNNEVDCSSEKANSLSDLCQDIPECISLQLPHNSWKTPPQIRNVNGQLYSHGISLNDKKYNLPDLNSQYHSYKVSPSLPSNQDNGKLNDIDEIEKVIEKIKLGLHVLIILRGLPGSGKSTLAKSLKFGGVICSTDDYFYLKGRYIFDASKLDEAHFWNQNRARESILNGITPVIIDNTNVEFWEMIPYVSMGKKYNYYTVILEPNTPWKFNVKNLANKNKHKVPKEKILRMLDKYQHNITVSSFDKILSSKCKKLPTSCVTDLTTVTYEKKHKKPFVSLEAIVHQEEQSTDHLVEKDFNNSDKNATAVPALKLFMSENLSIPCSEIKTQCEYTVEDAFENDNSIGKNMTINNLDELKTLILEDSEDSQSLSSKNDQISNQDVSSWEDITEHDDDFSWETALHDIVSTFQHDTLLQNGEHSSDGSKIIDFGYNSIDMLQSNTDVSPEHEAENEEPNNTHFHVATTINTPAPKRRQNNFSCSENILCGSKEHNCLKSCSDTAVNFEIDSNIKNDYFITPVTFLDDCNLTVMSEKLNAIEIKSNPEDAVHNHLKNLDNSKCEPNSTYRNVTEQNELNNFTIPISIENNVNSEFLPKRELKIESESGNVSRIKDVDYSSKSNALMIHQKVPIDENRYCVLQEQIKGIEKECLLNSVNPKPQRKDNKISMVFSKNVFENKSFDTISTDKENSLEECKKWVTDDNIEEKNDCSDGIEMKNICSVPKPPRNLLRSATTDKKDRNDRDANKSFLNEQSIKSNKKQKQRSPLFKQAHLYIEKDWTFPLYIQNDVSKDSISSDSAENIIYHSQITQTEPSDFILINKIERNQSYSSEYNILTSSGNEWTKKEALDFQHSEDNLKFNTSRVMSFEKSTCTEEYVIDVEKSEKISQLQECFPDICEDDLIHLMGVCHDDETWVVDLLLEAGYKYNNPDYEKYNAQCLNNLEENKLKFDFPVFKMGNNVDNIKFKKNEASSENKDISKNDSASNENQDQNIMDSNPNTIQTLQFALDPAFAFQLEELFGPVACKDSVSVPPVFEIDLEFAKLIHNKWKIYAQRESKLCNENVRNRRKDESRQPSDKKNKNCTNLSVVERNVGDPMTLDEIMDLEYALQIHKNEKLKEDTDSATKIKRLELYKKFPGADTIALDGIFESYNYSLEDSVVAIGESFPEPETLQHAEPVMRLDKCADQWNKTYNYEEFENNDWSAWVYNGDDINYDKEAAIPNITITPEAEKLRKIATDQYVLRQNCFQKAYNYYHRGMKGVASYYAQEGNNHGCKFREANKDAAHLINKQRNVSLPPSVLDLHGLYVQEAVPVLEKFLKDKKVEMRSRPQNGVFKVSVITGQGVHSIRGPKLYPSVVEYLKKNGYHFAVVTPGILEIYLNEIHQPVSIPQE